MSKVVAATPMKACPLDVLTQIREIVEGRSIGDNYIVNCTHQGRNGLVLELDDGTVFSLTCTQT